MSRTIGHDDRQWKRDFPGKSPGRKGCISYKEEFKRYMRHEDKAEAATGIEDYDEESFLDKCEDRLTLEYNGNYMYEWHYVKNPFEWGGDLYDSHWVDNDDHMKGWYTDWDSWGEDLVEDNLDYENHYE